MNPLRLAVVVVPLAVLSVVPRAHAQLLLSTNDNKVTLVNGVATVVKNPPPDTLTVIDIKSWPPQVVAELEVPGSVVGPPFSVAVAPDESIALVTANEKLDPGDPTKRIPNNTMSVVDLKATPPRIIATLETGRAPAGVSINRAGTLALVANRAEGTVSVYTVQGKTVTPAGKVTVADDKSGTSHAAISPDGKLALVTRDGDDRISVLSIDGTKVEYTKRDISAGLRPYGIDIASSGAFAAVANIGRGGGDADTVSIIDLKAQPPRVTSTMTVGQTPEGIKVSPDGSMVAVVVMNGSNKPKESPFYNDAGKLVLLRVSGTDLSRVGEAAIGHWSQGAAFTPDGKRIFVGNMVEKEIQVLSLDATTLKDTGVRIAVKGGPAAIRIADR
ncbi:MAG: mandelate racemase [Candidatus Rokuibacteriota bacterium]|nr:MAG: mandelate racemase [Candidatus Rokubacteria bacterium]